MLELFSKAISITPPSHKRRLLLVTVVASSLALFDSSLLLSVGPMVKGIVENADPLIFGFSVELRVLLIFAGAVLVLKNLLFIVVSRWKHSVLFDFQSFLSGEALQRILRHDLRRSMLLDSGKKASYVVNEPLQLVLNVYTQGISLIAELSLVVFITVSLLIVNLFETIILFGALTVLVGIFQWSTRGWLRASGISRREADGRRHELVRSVIDSEVDVRALSWYQRVAALYEEPNRRSSDMTANKAFATEIAKNIIELAVVVGVGLLIITSNHASAAELAPMLAVFGTAAYRLAPSFNRMMVCTQSMRFGLSSLQVIHELFRGSPFEKDQGALNGATAPVFGPRSTIEVNVKNLTSPSGITLLQDKVFTLTRGDIVVVTGPSGIGKSSLIKALVDGGPGIKISIDGAALPGGLAGCGLALGMMGQRPFVLPESLGYNVLPTFDRNRTASLSDQDLALQVLHSLADRHGGSVLDQNVIANNLHSPISVSTLSGGQSQRIALMRAMLFGQDFLLLDEPTSALDAASRDRFIELLRFVAPTRAVLIVSHDAALESIASQILELRSNP